MRCEQLSLLTLALALSLSLARSLALSCMQTMGATFPRGRGAVPPYPAPDPLSLAGPRLKLWYPASSPLCGKTTVVAQPRSTIARTVPKDFGSSHGVINAASCYRLRRRHHPYQRPVCRRPRPTIVVQPEPKKVQVRRGRRQCAAPHEIRAEPASQRPSSSREVGLKADDCHRR